MKWFWPAMDIIAAAFVWVGDLPVWWLKFLAFLFFVSLFVEHSRAAVGTVQVSGGDNG